ncbi:MAG: PEP-CTERM sorting domain-containing protein [Terriglobales bacterium]
MKIKAWIWGLALACGLGLVFPTAAAASPIVLNVTNCPTCDGNTYAVSLVQNTSTDYTLTVVANLSGYADGPAFLSAIAPKIPGVDVTTLTSAPGVANAGSWTPLTYTDPSTGINAGGCHITSGHNDFFCSDTANLGPTLTFNATGSSTPLTFVWDLSGANFGAGPIGASLKAQFEDSSGTKVGDLLSDDFNLPISPGSPVPEPATWALLATGLLALGITLKRQAFVVGGGR